MLGQRIVTAVILLAILAAAMISANPWWFVALLALAAACANWEWLRLTLPQPPSPLISVGVAVLLFAGMLALTSAWLTGDGTGASDPAWVLYYLVPAVAAVWLFGGVAAVVRGRSDAAPASLGWSVFSVLADHRFHGYAPATRRHRAGDRATEQHRCPPRQPQPSRRAGSSGPVA